MPLVLAGATSGSTTIQATDAVTQTITLPNATGTLVVTSGAQTIEFADGSASAPSITNSGDTNTGMFFPAADTIAFAEGGTEAMRIDSSGNVGIGTTSIGYNSKLNVKGTGSATAPTNINGLAGASILIESSQANTGFGGLTYNDGGGGGAAVIFGRGTSYDTQILFYTNPSATAVSGAMTERLRITDTGEVWIAGTTDRGAFNLQCNGTGVWGAGAYTNGSDERIKETITPLDTGLDVVAKLNPVTYKYKEEWSKDQSIQTGFIAQDLLVALEGKNYVDGIVNQSSEYMSVAYQNIIPILTKAIQEQQTIIETLKTDIAALKAKVNV